MHLGQAWAVCPANDVQRGYLEKYVEHVIDYFKLYYTYAPVSQKASGCITSGTDSPWMENFICLGSFFCWGLTRNATVKEMSDFCIMQTVGQVSHHIYRIYEYRTTPCQKTSVWTAGTNEFHAPADIPCGGMVFSINAATNTLTRTAGSNWLFRNGDPFWPSTFADSVGYTVVPSELVDGEQLYAVNCSGTISPMTLQLSRTVGGPPIDFTSDYTNISFSFIAAQMGDYTTAELPGTETPDSYLNIAGATINMGAHWGDAGALAQLTTVNTFLGPVNDSNWTTWRLR
jgi:hypothetical protein